MPNYHLGMALPPSDTSHEGSQSDSADQPAGPDSSAVLSVALAEFGKLRDEIAGRSNTLWTLLALNATVSSTVAGFVLAQKADPLLVLLLPLLAPSLGLLVIDHATNIGNIGEYINTVIKPLIHEATGEPRLLRYEEWVDKWETRSTRRVLAFGLPLILLFTVVPVASLVYTIPHLDNGTVWALWATGLALTAFQVALWVAFLAPPLVRAITADLT
jgi:hypothetical protein